MAGASLLTLLDDISTVLDDIAVMSKVAAKKTAGVLGDDLALNAQQVNGIAAEREIPVVWGVAKGSLRNKAILVPMALIFSAFVPWIIVPLLMLGGLYLSFEGAEKVIEKLFHHDLPKVSEEEDNNLKSESLAEYEQRKVKGAIRTDFILSAEIIVIALGTVQNQLMLDQIFVLIVVAVLMTAGVYGIVAAIVKLDDLGFFLVRYSRGKGFFHLIGQQLITFAPKLMKLLTLVGTLAMFLVGGGIVVEHTPVLHHSFVAISEYAPEPIQHAVNYILHGIFGLVVGSILVSVTTLVKKSKTN